MRSERWWLRGQSRVALARLCVFLVACRCRSLHTGRRWDQQPLSVSVRMTKRDLQCHIGCAARHVSFELKLEESPRDALT